MSSVALTPYQRKTLEVVRDNGPLHTSGVGYLLFADEQANRKKNPSPQGMALAAGRYLGPLHRLGLVSGYQGWRITDLGRTALEDSSNV